MSSAPPFPWRTIQSGNEDDNGAPSSDLLRRVQDFLPQLQEANKAVTASDPHGLRIDDCLMPAEQEDDKDDDENSNEELKDNHDTSLQPQAKKLRARVHDDDDDDDDDDTPQQPTIQLDLTLGVDARHPVMSILAADKTSDPSNNHDDIENKEEEDMEESTKRAELAVQNLLGHADVPATKRPLITEVTKDNDVE